MTDPVYPPKSAMKLTSNALEVRVEKAQENAAPPHVEAADPYYEAFLCDQIKMLAEDMQFPEQWAAEIGVTEARMFSWIDIYPEFAEAYAVAITKLRAAFTHELLHVAKGKRFGAVGPLYVLVAKKRFPDLFGDDPTPRPSAPRAPRDITPPDAGSGPQTIDGTFEDMQEEQLQAELDALRARHNT